MYTSSVHLRKIFGCNCNFLNIAPAQEIPNVTKDDQYAIRNVGNNGNQQGSFLKRLKVLHLGMQFIWSHAVSVIYILKKKHIHISLITLTFITPTRKKHLPCLRLTLLLLPSSINPLRCLNTFLKHFKRTHMSSSILK